MRIKNFLHQKINFANGIHWFILHNAISNLISNQNLFKSILPHMLKSWKAFKITVDGGVKHI